MWDGWIKAAAASPEIRVADCQYNAAQIQKTMQQAGERGAQLLVLPELCLTGYTCQGSVFAAELDRPGQAGAVGAGSV